MANSTDMKMIKCNLKGLLLSKIGGVCLNNLLSEYKNLYNEELEYKSLGFSSPLALLKSFPDIAAIETFGKDQKKVFGVKANGMNVISKKAEHNECRKEVIFIKRIPQNATKDDIIRHMKDYPFENLRLFPQKNLKTYFGSITLPKSDAEKLLSDQSICNFEGSTLLFVYPVKPKCQQDNEFCDSENVQTSKEDSQFEVGSRIKRLVHIKGIPFRTTKESLCRHFEELHYNFENMKIYSVKYGNQFGSIMLPAIEAKKLLLDQSARNFDGSQLQFEYPNGNIKNSISTQSADNLSNNILNSETSFDYSSSYSENENEKLSIDSTATVPSIGNSKMNLESLNYSVYIENLPSNANSKDVLRTFQIYGDFQVEMISAEEDGANEEREEKSACIIKFHHLSDAVKLFKETNILMVLDQPVRLNFTEILPNIKKCLDFDNLIVNLDVKTRKRVVTQLVVEFPEPPLHTLPISMTKNTLSLMYSDVFPGQKMLSKDGFKSKIRFCLTHKELSHSDYFWGRASRLDPEIEEVLNLNHQQSNFKPFDFRSRRAIIRHEKYFARTWVKSVHGNTAEVFLVDHGNTQSVSIDKLLSPPESIWDVPPRAVPFRVQEKSFNLVSNLVMQHTCKFVGTEGVVFVVANLLTA